MIKIIYKSAMVVMLLASVSLNAFLIYSILNTKPKHELIWWSEAEYDILKKAQQEIEQLKKDALEIGSARDFGHDIIPSLIKNHNVFSFPFVDTEGGEQAYWRDVGTLNSYWEANMKLVSPEPALNMYDQNWPIMTHQEQLAPAKFVFNEDLRCGFATDSTVANGCIVSGARIKHSLLFSSVHVHSLSIIEDSVILPSVDIGRNCRIRRAIIDRGCRVPANMIIGHNNEQDRRNGFRISPKGIVLVTQDMLEALNKPGKIENNINVVKSEEVEDKCVY